RARLPAHMVPAVLQRLDALPVMANGKLDRRALPDPVDTPNADDALPSAPRDAREARLLDIWRTVLGSDRVGVHDNFFEAGGDSILSLQVVARAAQAGLHFSLQTFYAQPVIASLARVASEAPHDAAPLPAESHAPLPLTPIQRAFFERFPAGESHWNQTVTLRVDGELDVARVIAALRAMIATHDALRLRFFHDAGQASPGWRQQVQAIDTVEALDTPHTLLDLADFDGDASAPHWPAALREIGTRLQASLDIGAGRLLRAAYVRLRGEGRLVLTAHHLAVDGMSWRLLFETFERAYAGNASDAKADALPWSAWVEQQQAASGTPDAAAPDAWTAMHARADAAAARAQTAAARLVAAAEAHVAPEAPARLRDTEVLAFTLPADLTARLL
ncbi:hypothetical protein G3N59_36660, partial [Paraburkholderia sp. Ac-20340]|uniref:condensation domain-containing protein n=1 Tax=Paraburkholderia sp. Ac-20340 TaxID=2703888 RepID=UPI001F11B4C3